MISFLVRYTIIIGDSLESDKVSKAVENFVAYPLIILIGLYILASAIVPFIHLNNQTFTIIFTLAGGIPALTFFFKEKRCKQAKNDN
ncbi:hypothetical protein KAS24_03865 [Candidatus Bathyarchaeota archaeon]|nr:hypothetical protein [Candidatus Bathyarchaeota archaeon]